MLSDSDEELPKRRSGKAKRSHKKQKQKHDLSDDSDDRHVSDGISEINSSDNSGETSEDDMVTVSKNKNKDNRMVRQTIDEDSDSEEECTEMQKQKHDKNINLVVNHDKQNELVVIKTKDKTLVETNVARRQVTDEVIEIDSDESSAEEPKKTKRNHSKLSYKEYKKPEYDSDDDSNLKPRSKITVENPRRSPRVKAVKKRKKEIHSDVSSENNSDDISDEHDNDSDDEAEADEDVDEEEFDSDADFDEQPCSKAKIKFFEENNIFDWSRYLSVPEDNIITKEISKDFFPPKGNIKISHIRKLMVKRNWDIHDIKRQQLAKRKISFCLKNCRETIKTWLNRFLVDFAPQCNIFYTDKITKRKRRPKTTSELMDAISHYETEDEVKNCFSLFYFSFDYMTNYAQIVSDLVMTEHSIQIDRQELAEERAKRAAARKANQKKVRKKLSCVQRLVSITLNDVRKPFRKLIKDKYGIDFTLKRSSDQITHQNRREIRRPGCLYDYMLKGSFKFPTRKNVKLAKQFLIKLIPATELESVKDLEKAENMYQKALAYAAQLKDSINKAQNISEDNEVNDNEPQDIELVTNDKKKKPPPSSNKETSHNRKKLPRSTKEVKKNYGNNTSDSETDSDDLIEVKQKAYKIPRKNEISDIKKKNEIEITNQKVLTKKSKDKRTPPTRKEVTDLFDDSEDYLHINNVNKKKQSVGDGRAINMTNQEEAREALILIKRRREKAKEDLRNQSSDESESEESEGVYKKQKVSNEEKMRKEKQHEATIKVYRDAELLVSEYNKTKTTSENITKTKSDGRVTLEGRLRELQQLYSENVKNYPSTFDRGERLLNILSDEQHDLFLDIMLKRLNLTDERFKLLNLQKKRKRITKELLSVLHKFMLEDECSTLTELSVEEKRVVYQRISDRLLDIQMTMFEKHKIPVKEIIAKEAIKEKISLLYNKSPERHAMLDESLKTINTHRELFVNKLEQQEQELRNKKLSNKTEEVANNVIELIDTEEEIQDKAAEDNIEEKIQDKAAEDNIEEKIQDKSAEDYPDVNAIKESTPNRELFLNEQVTEDVENKEMQDKNDDKIAPVDAWETYEPSDKSIENDPMVKAMKRQDAEKVATKLLQVSHAMKLQVSEYQLAEHQETELAKKKEAEDAEMKKLHDAAEEEAMKTPQTKPGKKVDADSQRSTRKKNNDEENNVRKHTKDSNSQTNATDNTTTKPPRQTRDVYEIDVLKTPTAFTGEGEEALITILNHRKVQGWKIELEVLDKRQHNAKPYFAIIHGCYRNFPHVTVKYLNYHNLFQHNSREKYRKLGYKSDPISKQNRKTHDFDEFTDIPKFLKCIKKHTEKISKKSKK